MLHTCMSLQASFMYQLQVRYLQNQVTLIYQLIHTHCTVVSMNSVDGYKIQGSALFFQGIIWPQVITGVIVNILNAVINYVFLFVLDLGVA